MKILALFSRVLSRAFPESFLQRPGLLAALQSLWANRRVVVSPLRVRLALDAGIKGTILDGSE